MAKWYAVNSKFEGGSIYATWDACKAYTNGRKGCKMKSFKTIQEAEMFAFGEVKTHAVGPVFEGDGVDYSDYIQIYTDGATPNNGSKDKSSITAGIGVFFGDGHKWNLSEPFPLENPTNQRAEIYAIIRAMEQLDAYLVPKDAAVVLFTDSMYCCKAFSDWIPRWRKTANNWMTRNNEPVKNRQLFEKMYDLLHARKVVLQHVRGHCGIHGNEMADKLAVAGCVLFVSK